MTKGIRARTGVRESDAGFNMRDEMLAAQLMSGMIDDDGSDGDHEDGKSSLSRKLDPGEQALIKQTQYELEQVLKQLASQEPNCKYPQCDKKKRDELFEKIYKGGVKESTLLGTADSFWLVGCFAMQELGISEEDVEIGFKKKKSFLDRLRKDHPDWLSKFKVSKWHDLLKDFRFFERGRQVDLRDFKTMRSVGRGAFGVVSVALNRVTGEILALKEMNKYLIKHKGGKNGKKIVISERQILATLGENPHHTCLSLRYACETIDSYCLLFPFCAGGDLDYRQKQIEGYLFDDLDTKGIPEPEVQFYAAEVGWGLAHCHKLRILHRDIKPMNVLLTDKGHCVLSDFGLATKLKEDKLEKNGSYGTPGYLPPEMIEGKTHSFAADWYAYGCMLYCLLRGLDPWHPLFVDGKSRKDAALECEPKFDEEYFSPAAKDFISKLMEKDQTKRLRDFEEMKKHEFFKGVNWKDIDRGTATTPIQPGVGLNPQSILALNMQDAQLADELGKVRLTSDDTIKGFNFVSRKSHRSSMKSYIMMMHKRDKEFKALPTWEHAVKEDPGVGDTEREVGRREAAEKRGALGNLLGSALGGKSPQKKKSRRKSSTQKARRKSVSKGSGSGDAKVTGEGGGCCLVQ